jgi:hypothetical protein
VGNKLIEAVNECRPKESEKTEFVERQDGATLTCVSPRIRTLEEAIAKADIDIRYWTVERTVINSWEVGAKGPDGTIVVEPLWQVKVWLKPSTKRWIVDGTELLHQWSADHKPDYSKWKIGSKCGDYLGLVGLYDVHFGKLAWRGESYADYDLKIAKELYLEAIDKCLDIGRKFSVAQWKFPIGEDLIHIDTPSATTTAGTPQDIDGRYAKIFDVAGETIIESIDKLLTVAPVEASYHSSNHDRTVSYHLAREIDRHYRDVKKVNVDLDWHDRKYLVWGKNLLGFTHKNQKNLPALMAQERPKEWGEAKFRSWFTGHMHYQKRVETIPALDKDGVVVHQLSSLSAADAWHYQHGFLSDRASEMFLIHRNGLDRCQFISRVNT